MHREKYKKMAYVLHTEFGYTKTAIANLMQISPQQMGQWIKEAGYEIRLNQANIEIDALKNELMQIGYQPQKPLNSNDFIDLDF
jgi:predicted transcriptional regulator